MKNAPAGCLKSQKKAGKTYYYHQFMDEQSNQEMRMYIKKNNRELAEKLAQKGYLLHIRSILKNNLRALAEFEEKYDESAMEKVYDELNDERKSLVKTIDTSVNEKIKMWNEEEYEPNASYPEMLKRPLKMMIDEREETIYPDFTILNIHTGKITYWEHAGCLDDTKYANGFVRKMNTYINNKLVLGDDFVCTYESSKYPLDISAVKYVVKNLL